MEQSTEGKMIADTTLRHGEVDADLIAVLATQAGLPVVDRLELPERVAQFKPVPSSLAGKVRDVLSQRYPNGLYAHQAEAIERALAGADICIATPTASGKTLAFTTVAAHTVVEDPNARVIALYPALALIQDQIEKWREDLGPLGVRIGRIDGQVPIGERLGILKSSQVLIMTPDIVHAWLLRRRGEAEVREFLDHLRLLILDEGHVYDGRFGSNTAYLLRRLEAATRTPRIIAATATVGDPDTFVGKLTGRTIETIGAERDGSPAPKRVILHVDGAGPKSFRAKAAFLRELAIRRSGRFLAFADSRMMVETLCVEASRARPQTRSADASQVPDDVDGAPAGILPYRSGYSGEDRRRIQNDLRDGRLNGVIATNAMELGVDIGDIDIVVLLNPPRSAKAFSQRLGRTGRTRPGVCVLIDDGTLLGNIRLKDYVQRPNEPSWLYLENRRIQYAHALCAANELRAAGISTPDRDRWDTLPESFREMIANELCPSRMLDPDLQVIKQSSAGTPHLHFALRGDGEPDIRIRGPHQQEIGSMTKGYALREAYPGAIYYHQGRPFRVTNLAFSKREILVTGIRAGTTKPYLQAKVFPNFQGGILSRWENDRGSVFEVEVQISERVLGFREMNGPSGQEHWYGLGSPYAQDPPQRYFPTTGVCWFFPQQPDSEKAGQFILSAFCKVANVQANDVGVGMFHAQASPLGPGPCRGLCLYDATPGSLRLTQVLGERMAEVVELAGVLAMSQNEPQLARDLGALSATVEVLPLVYRDSTTKSETGDVDPTGIMLIQTGGVGILVNSGETREVAVKGHRLTSTGLFYELEPDNGLKLWLVKIDDVQPIPGYSPMVRLNVAPLETVDVASGGTSHQPGEALAAN